VVDVMIGGSWNERTTGKYKEKVYEIQRRTKSAFLWCTDIFERLVGKESKKFVNRVISLA